MPTFPMPPLPPISFEEALEQCHRVARERGIALLVPGDLHLWGIDGGNRSELFVQLLDTLNYDKVVLLGDLLDGNTHERETQEDRAILERLRALDESRRLHVVRGNHDRDLLRQPHRIRERAERSGGQGEAGDVMDLTWLTRPRVHQDVVYYAIDADDYYGPAHKDAHMHALVWDTHPGSVDILVVRVADKHILFEHGDAHDKWAKRAHDSSVVGYVGKCGYDLMVRLERRHSSLGDLSGTLKQRVSRWRGVCRDVAHGANARGRTLGLDIHANVCGHTHYPTHTSFEGITHTNVGSFRGWRPSFVLVTRDTGEVLPPVVVRHERR